MPRKRKAQSSVSAEPTSSKRAKANPTAPAAEPPKPTGPVVTWSPTPMPELPVEIIQLISDFMPAAAAARFAKTSRYHHAAVNDVHYWAVRLHKHPSKPAFTEELKTCKSIMAWIHCLDTTLCVGCRRIRIPRNSYPCIPYPICYNCTFDHDSCIYGLVSVSTMYKLYKIKPGDMPTGSICISKKCRFTFGTYYLRPQVMARVAELHGSWTAFKERAVVKRCQKGQHILERKQKIAALPKKTYEFSKDMVAAFLANGRGWRELKKRLERDYDFLETMKSRSYPYTPAEYARYRDEHIKTPEELLVWIDRHAAGKDAFKDSIVAIFPAIAERVEQAVAALPELQRDHRVSWLNDIIVPLMGVSVQDIRSKSEYDDFATSSYQVTPASAGQESKFRWFARNLVRYLYERHLWNVAEHDLLTKQQDPSEFASLLTISDLKTMLLEHGLRHRGMSRRSDSGDLDMECACATLGYHRTPLHSHQPPTHSHHPSSSLWCLWICK
ncbi:uncharacterized protein BJ171DRAFT_495816 [Polychytrium aggregatum]|uniref:uncharacterized protein n=1 Tax=Polychytrium aggregatum TaxID=110093 RepID=UPI0022FE2C39|nr:uncharacterized protein BJ171DRAFT_495816 [Polychytrium aggregatum]KAI9206557.1 hypothetical protein BJ171DRAFT_495816 [Polychytrium aggregatum]